MKAATGIVCPSQRVSVAPPADEIRKVGIPNEVRASVVTLINLWDREDPVLVKVLKPLNNKVKGRRRMMKEGERAESEPGAKPKDRQETQERGRGQ